MGPLIEQLRQSLCGWPSFPRSVFTAAIALLPALVVLLSMLYRLKDADRILRELSGPRDPQLDAARWARRQRFGWLFFGVVMLIALASMAASVILAIALTGCAGVSKLTAWQPVVVALLVGSGTIWAEWARRRARS